MSDKPLPPEETRFKAGQSGNPGGKPKGARNRIQGSFLNALADDFDVYGKAAIVEAREKDAMGYIRTVASLLPKQVEDVKPLEELTDDELTAGIALLRARLAAGAGAREGQAIKLPSASPVPSLQ
jgi:hypothetical protein